MASGTAVTAELESWRCFWRLLISSVTACLVRSPSLLSSLGFELFSALERCRQLLVSTPSDAPVDTPVQLLLVDVAAMARALMARLR
jgi:hypothetical protein